MLKGFIVHLFSVLPFAHSLCLSVRADTSWLFNPLATLQPNRTVVPPSLVIYRLVLLVENEFLRCHKVKDFLRPAQEDGALWWFTDDVQLRGFPS